MTSFALHTDIDPSGLNGQRYVRNEKAAPYIVEVWGYPSHVTLEDVRAAWLKVLPLGSCAGFTEEKRTHGSGVRLVKIDRFERPARAPVHIEEPNV